MEFRSACIAGMSYELGPIVLSTQDLVERLESSFKTLRLPFDYLESVTGVHERRLWEARYPVSEGAIKAANKTLDHLGLKAEDLDLLTYTSVCRESFEPATAALVARGLGLKAEARVYDISNACLGFLDGILDAVHQIEAGRIRIALVSACESSRDIIDLAVARLARSPDFKTLAPSLATFTGGSGAAACIVAHEDVWHERGLRAHRLKAVAARNAVQHAGLCSWGIQRSQDGQRLEEVMNTDAVGILKHGLELGRTTWNAFCSSPAWHGKNGPTKVISHQIGQAHRSAMLEAFGLAQNADFPTYPYLGNMGTVSIPASLAIAEERGFLQGVDTFGLLGIGSGLTCLMLGFQTASKTADGGAA